jgi:hypothetical protein
MVEMFMEGGWGMWAILIFGLTLVGVTVRFAARPRRGQIPFIAAMALTTLVSTAHATWTDFGAVFKAVSDEKRVPDGQMGRVLMEGMKECTRPGSFGGAVLTFACVLFAVGVLRMSKSEE